MNKIFESIHGSKKADKAEVDVAFERFAKQTQDRNVFYVVVNGIAMPLAAYPRA